MEPVVPTEILTHILWFLDEASDTGSLSSCSRVSSTLRRLSQSSLFRHLHLSTIPRAEALLSIFKDNPSLRDYSRSVALCAPVLNSEYTAASRSEENLHFSAAAEILAMLTDLRRLYLQFHSVYAEGCTGAWALVPVGLQTVLCRLLDGSSESAGKIQELYLSGAQDFPADFITTLSTLRELNVSGCAFNWQTLQPTAAIRARIDKLTASWDTVREFATHAPVFLSELQCLNIFVDDNWNGELGSTTALFDVCASSLSKLRIVWTSDTAPPPLRLNKPLESLHFLDLYLPSIDFQHRQDQEPQSITADSTLQWLLNSLEALSPAVALTDIKISLCVDCTMYPESSWVGEDIIRQNHFLKPLPPRIQELWTAIDTTISTTRNFPSLRQITLSTSLHFVDWLERDQIAQFALALESTPEFDFAPLESYMELAPPRDRRRAKELFLRADSDLLPLTAERVHVEHEQSVTFDQWPID